VRFLQHSYIENAMERATAREEAKNRVIAAGNAQAVFNRLGEIEKDRSANLSRWVWELLQNARDAAGTETNVHVVVGYDGSTLVFEHDGPPFRDDEIAHLIFHGSTKHDTHKGIGRFGTGFISTHLLSRCVQIRGPLDDGTVFDFTLDRTGQDANELKEAMDRSWRAMNASIRSATNDDKDGRTTFSYPIDTNVAAVVIDGLEVLGRVAPLILAFNPQFNSLRITVNGTCRTYSAGEPSTPVDEVYNLPIVDEANESAATVLASKNGDVTVAIAVSTDSETSENATIPTDGMSRIYVAFPLSETSGYPFRAAVNSELLEPRTERDGIYLEADNLENRERYEHACRAFGALVEYVASQKMTKVTDLAMLTAPVGLRSVNADWLKTTINNLVVADLANRPILLTHGGAPICPARALIPIAGAGERSQLWTLYASLVEFRNRLPLEADIDGWNEVLNSWSAFTGEQPERRPETRTLESLVSYVQRLETVSALASKVQGDVWQWLSSLLELLRNTDKLHLAQTCAIIPSQSGALTKGSTLLVDGGIPAELKDLADELGISCRSELLATELEGSFYVNELDTKSLDDSMRDLLEALAADDEPRSEKARPAAVKLFCFVARRKLRIYLERIPIVTAGSRLTATRLKLSNPTRDRMLAPVARWQENVREFADLYPGVHLLHPDYAVSLTCDDTWSWLCDVGAINTTPLVRDAGIVEDFLDVEQKDGKKDKSRSKDKIERWHLAYFAEDDSVIDRVRGSRRLGILLVRFLLNAVIPKDPEAFSKIDVDCDEEKPRQCYGAAWIMPLLERRWIKLSEKQWARLTAESLAELLVDHPDIIKNLLGESQRPFLRVCDISPADLALRSVGRSETDRMSLIQSLNVIANVVGHDPAAVARFAATIQTDGKVLEYIQQRSDFIDRIARNQTFGLAVEREFRVSFPPETGVSIKRTGLGHDFVLAPIAGQEDDAGQVEMSFNDRRVWVELKATKTGDAVRMSVRQVEAATTSPECYWLCVVVIEDGQVTSEALHTKARFVCDIGNTLKDAWSKYKNLANAIPEAVGGDDEASLEVSGQEVKFRIGYKVWSDGLTFDAAVDKLRAGVTMMGTTADPETAE